MEWETTDQVPAGGLYTRALVGDLCPEAMTPMTVTAGLGAELNRAWHAALLCSGLCTDPREEAALRRRRPVARFGYHLYFDTALLRIAGERLSGADPLAFSRQYLGERADVPRQFTGWPATGQRRLGTPPVGAEAVARETGERATLLVGDTRRSRPDLAGATSSALLARIVAVRGALAEAAQCHARAELGTAVACELLVRLAEEAGQPTPTGAQVGGLLVDETLTPLWDLARLVARSDVLARRWDRGSRAAAREVQAGADEDTRRFRAAVQNLAGRYGHAGGTAWELSAQTWETDPGLLFGLVDTLRRAPEDAEPAVRAERAATSAADLTAQVRTAQRRSPHAAARFEATLGAARGWLRSRERARQAVSAVHHEQRMAARELGRRSVESGVLDDVDQIFMLRLGEFDAFDAEPARLGEDLRMRSYDHHALAGYQPPFVTIGPAPPVVRWPRREPGADAGPGTRTRGPVRGTPGSGGRAAGPARLPRHPGDLRDVRPGHVLVLPSAGPAWVPLTVTASAVVVDAGSALSDVAVACRDLGTPCLVACTDATRRIGAGTAVAVDARTGTVEPDAGAGHLAGRYLVRADYPPDLPFSQVPA